jgi:hypothetical protein
VTIDVVDQDGKPVQGDNTFISVWQKRPGANYWAIRVNGEGRATEKFPPGSYRLTYDGKDSRESAEISVSVVSPGDGDYFKMVVNKTVKLRGRVVDVAKKPLKAWICGQRSSLHFTGEKLTRLRFQMTSANSNSSFRKVRS